MKKTILMLAVAVISSTISVAQFTRKFSCGNHRIIVNDAVTLNDNSVVICGEDATTSNALLVRVDQSGNLLWWNEYDGMTHFRRMIRAQDNDDVLLITDSRPPMVGGVVSDFRWTVCRINPAGIILWTNDYDCSNGATTDVERGYFIAPATNNPDEYFIGGAFNTNGTWPNGVGLDDIMLIKIDGGMVGLGAVVSVSQYDNDDDEFRTGTDDGNGGCVIIGNMVSPGASGSLAEFDNNCNMVAGNEWRFGTNNTVVRDIERIGSDYYLLGTMANSTHGDLYLMQTTSAFAGGIVWQKSLGVDANYSNLRLSIVDNHIYVTYVDNTPVLANIREFDMNGNYTNAIADLDCQTTAVIIPQLSTGLYYINTSPNPGTLGVDLYVVSNSLAQICWPSPLHYIYNATNLAKVNENFTLITPTYNITNPPDDAKGYAIKDTIPCPVQLNEQLCKYICNEDQGDYGRSIITTQDNEVAVFGTMFDADPSPESDMYFGKFDNNLNSLGLGTAKKIGDHPSLQQEFESGFSIMQASDGYYYMIGTTQWNPGNRDVYIVKLDAAYNIMWAKNYGQSLYDEFGIKLVERNDPLNPGLVVVGYRQEVGPIVNPHRIFAFRIDFNGIYNAAVKTHIYAGGPTANYDDFAWDAISLKDTLNGIAIVGESNGTDQRLLAFRIDQTSLYEMDPSSYYVINDTPNVNQVAYGIVEYDNNVYITGSTTSPNGNGAMDACILMLPSDFHTWSLSLMNIYGKASDNYADECGYSIIKSDDNNLIVAGYKYVYHPGQKSTRRDGLVFKVNINTLNLMWHVNMQNAPNDYKFNDVLYDLVQLPDGFLALTGYKGLTLTDTELFLSKLNSNGQASCCFVDYPMNKEKGSKSEYYFNELAPIPFKYGAYKHDEDHNCEVILCKEEIQTREGDGVTENNFLSTFDPDKKILLYPNPSNGRFKVALSNQDEHITAYTIIDVSGRILISKGITQEGKNSIMEIALPGFAPGIYFIEVQTSSDRIRTKLIIE